MAGKACGTEGQHYSRLLQRMKTIILLNFVFVCVAYGVDLNDPTVTFEEMYPSGVDAYNEGKWFECTNILNTAIEDYKFYRHTISSCRSSCRTVTKSEEIESRIAQLLVFEKLIESSSCQRRCRKLGFGERPDIRPDVDLILLFEKRIPYNYLQFCYYKVRNMTDMSL